MILLEQGLLPTPSELEPAERRLRDDLGGDQVLWCGRGASALCWAYRLAALARGLENPEIILPAIGCASLASTALASGLVPRFADVDPATGMPTLADLQRLYTPNTCAVLFVHLFGNTADLRAIQGWCRRCGITLIEDVAQSLGARLPYGGLAGSIGDLVICSFSRTKLISCGGGALVIRSREFLPLLHAAGRLLPPASDPPAPLEQALECSYRDLQYGLSPLLRTGTAPDVTQPVLLLQRYYQPLWMRPLPSASRLAEGFARLESSLAERRYKAGIYAATLRDGPWKLLDGWCSSGVCWRFTLLVANPDHQIPLTEALRGGGFHVSNLYWPLSQMFSVGDRTARAEDFGRRVLNLWVDDTVNRDWVGQCAASALRHCREVCGC